MEKSLPEVYRKEIYSTKEKYEVKYGITITPDHFDIGTHEDCGTIRGLAEHIKNKFDFTNPIELKNMEGCKIRVLRIHKSKNVVCTLKKKLREHELKELSCLLTE